ncbi:6205_t:CDS:2, partial [Gigaspora margarita]
LPNLSHYVNMEIAHNPWTSTAWFETTEAHELDKIETELNKIVEANPTDINPSCPLYSQQAKDRHIWI